MVNDEKGMSRKNPTMGMSNDNSPEQRTGEPGVLPSKKQTDSDLPSKSSRHDSNIGLIPALRVILSSVERTIGSPLGKNEYLAQALRRLHTLLGRLTRMSDTEFIAAIEALADGQGRQQRGNHIEADPQILRALPLDEIERMISDPKITKQQLLAIVRERFGGSTGTLAKLKHDALLEWVASLAMNERSHETVARLASGDANQHSSKTATASQ